MARGMTYANAAEAIGNTPMVRINKLVPVEHAVVYAKCEFFQPLNSVKDRIGAAMINAAEKRWKDHSKYARDRTHQRQHGHRIGFCVAPPRAIG